MSAPDPPNTSDDVEVLACDPVYTGYVRVDRYRLRHRLFEGGWSAPMQREVLERGHAVGVILYDPDRDLLVLIEQFRVGPLAAGRSPGFAPDFSPWLLEIVAGIIDAGEDPETVARREAIEEAGCEVGELIPACRFLVSPGISSESISLYCGRIDAGSVGGIHGLDDEHEDIRVFAAPAEQVFGWIDEGRFVNATAIVALQWFRHNRQRIRALWQAEPA